MTTDKTGTCFTMGYSDLPVEVFVYFLKKAGIDTVVDVRSSPYSRYQPPFNREDISRTLTLDSIDYLYMGDMLGGRYSSPELLFPDGTVNYEKVCGTKNFISGLDRVVELMQEGKTVSLMCSEKDPLNCHRFVLIGKNLRKRGVEVVHLYPELIKKTHAELEDELLSQAGLKGQKTLMGSEPDSTEIMYTRLNKKIGYKTVPQAVDGALQFPQAGDGAGKVSQDADVHVPDRTSSGRTDGNTKKEHHQKTLF